MKDNVTKILLAAIVFLLAANLIPSVISARNASYIVVSEINNDSEALTQTLSEHAAQGFTLHSVAPFGPGRTLVIFEQ